MGSLRTPDQWAEYERYKAAGHLEKGCPLCLEGQILKEFKHWLLLYNKFPYDRIAKVHHMILPKRHVTEEELSRVELEEYAEIKERHLSRYYEFIIEATPQKKSIPEHFHLHLIEAKD